MRIERQLSTMSVSEADGPLTANLGRSAPAAKIGLRPGSGQGHAERCRPWRSRAGRGRRRATKGRTRLGSARRSAGSGVAWGGKRSGSSMLAGPKEAHATGGPIRTGCAALGQGRPRRAQVSRRGGRRRIVTWRRGEVAGEGWPRRVTYAGRGRERLPQEAFGQGNGKTGPRTVLPGFLSSPSLRGASWM